jgi:V8-like Glu-specific endopeptidase
MTVGGALAAVSLGGLVLTGAASMPGGAARAVGADPASASGAAVEYHVSAAAQRSALAYWTPARMAAAQQAETLPQAAELPNVSAPKGTPTPVHFTGVRSVGALFSLTGKKGHFCSASVVDSTGRDLVLTAAHCVWNSGPSINNVYVPGYYKAGHTAHEPYGAWAISGIYVAPGWADIDSKTHKPRHNPAFDFAFLTMTPVKNREIQFVTGGLRIGIGMAYRQKIEVIGYNDTDNEPIRCATKSFEHSATQMEFYCNDYWTGTSGGPWIIDFNLEKGTGTVFGVIGGYEEGGSKPWASYSSYFGATTLSVFEAAEKAQSSTSTPTQSPSPSQSPTTTSSPSASPAP